VTEGDLNPKSSKGEDNHCRPGMAKNITFIRPYGPVFQCMIEIDTTLLMFRMKVCAHKADDARPRVCEGRF